MAAEDTSAIMATLRRGRVYVYKNERFERNIPRPVSEEMARELEELADIITDEEGEQTEKRVFKVERPGEDESGGSASKVKRPVRRRV